MPITSGDLRAMGFASAQVDAALARASGDGDIALEALLNSHGKRSRDAEEADVAPRANRPRRDPAPAAAATADPAVRSSPGNRNQFRHRSNVWRRVPAPSAAPAAATPAAAARAAAPAAAAPAAAPSAAAAPTRQSWHVWLASNASADAAVFNSTIPAALRCAEALANHKRVAVLAASAAPPGQDPASSSLPEPGPLHEAARIHMSVSKTLSETQLQRQASGLQTNTRKAEDAHSAQLVVSRHRAALELLLDPTVIGAGLTVERITSVHAVLVNGDQHAGELRTTSNARCGSTSFLPPKDVPAAMIAYVAAVNTLCERDDVDEIGAAAAAHSGLIAIHPFHDGNGRMARLLMNFVLVRRGLPFTVVASSTEEQRVEYIKAVRECASRPGAPSNVLALANLLAGVCHRVWAELERLVQRAQRQHAEAAADANVRAARERSRTEGCMICLEEGCNIAALCCGAPCHLNCFAQWLAEAGEPTCCQCREPLPRPPLRPAPPQPAAANAAVAVEEDASSTTTSTTSSSSASGSDSSTTTTTTTTTTAGGNASPASDHSPAPNYSPASPASSPPASHGDDTTTTTSASSDDSTTTTSADASPSRTPSPRSRFDSRGRQVCPHCSSQPARNCANFSCGRCCGSHGYYRCERHHV